MAAAFDDVTGLDRLIERLLPDHEGKFALIRHGDLVRICDTYEAALGVGYAQFKREPFLVQRIEPSADAAHHFHSTCRR